MTEEVSCPPGEVAAIAGDGKVIGVQRGSGSPSALRALGLTPAQSSLPHGRGRGARFAAGLGSCEPLRNEEHSAVIPDEALLIWFRRTEFLPELTE
jgi:hypothetical protein